MLSFLNTTVFSQNWGVINHDRSIEVKTFPPVWSGCEGLSSTDTDACFNRKLTDYISQNLQYPVEALKNNQTGVVNVSFYTTEKGIVRIRSIKGGSKLLRQEAKRLIKSIPKMTQPGTLGGIPSNIGFHTAITFSL